MIAFDEFTLSLPRHWAALCVVLILDVVLVSSNLTGLPRLHGLLAMMPRGVGSAIFLFGPFVLAVLWLIVVVLGVGFHRRSGLWLLATGLLILPATYLHWVFVWGCVVAGQCL